MVKPLANKKTLVLGGNGQLGVALRSAFSEAEYTDRSTFDITNPAAYEKFDWQQYGTIINAAAYTACDGAETPLGRRNAWEVNVTALSRLAKIAAVHKITLVHISSDYVFDGTIYPHIEDEPFSPLNVYGQTKAAGDAIVVTVPQHYIIRTSWVVGEGKNFVRTMQSLCMRGVKPAVVDDQFGRLTFTEDLAAGIKYLLDNHSPYGTYNLSNEGEIVTWATIAKAVFLACGGLPDDISTISTDSFNRGKEFIAPRPSHSELDLQKIEATGFKPRLWQEALQQYLKADRR